MKLFHILHYFYNIYMNKKLFTAENFNIIKKYSVTLIYLFDFICPLVEWIGA